jgi:hypothetical protein
MMMVMNHGVGENDDADDADVGCAVVDGADDLRNFCMPNL